MRHSSFVLFFILAACGTPAEQPVVVILDEPTTSSPDSGSSPAPEDDMAVSASDEDMGVVERDAETPADDAGPTDDDPPTKAEAAATAGEWSTDYCEDLGWYDDGACDDFCPLADADCFDEEVLLAREYARAMNVTDEAECRIHGIMKNDNDGVFYWGRLFLHDSPPKSCRIVAEVGACFVRECDDLDAIELEIPMDLTAGVGFTTNQSRWSSNPYWNYGSANTFGMPPRGGDIEIGWKYATGERSVTRSAPSVVSAVDVGSVAVGQDLIVDLTYQRTATEETAAPSTTIVRVTGSGAEFSEHLDRSVECLVPDTVTSVRVDDSLLDAIGLESGFWMRAEAGGFVAEFAEIDGCQGAAVVAKRPSGRESYVGAKVQLP